METSNISSSNVPLRPLREPTIIILTPGPGAINYLNTQTSAKRVLYSHSDTEQKFLPSSVLKHVTPFERRALITKRVEMSQTQNTERAVKLARESIELLDAGHTEVRVFFPHFPEPLSVS